MAPASAGERGVEKKGARSLALRAFFGGNRDWAKIAGDELAEDNPSTSEPSASPLLSLWLRNSDERRNRTRVVYRTRPERREGPTDRAFSEDFDVQDVGAPRPPSVQKHTDPAVPLNSPGPGSLPASRTWIPPVGRRGSPLGIRSVKGGLHP